MTPQDELRAWTAACAAVLERDIAHGKASACPTEPELETALLAACLDARDTLDRIVREGGHWQGEWVRPETWRRRREVVHG